MMAEGNIGGCEKRAFIGLCEVRDPRMYGNSTREIREALPTPNEGGSGPVGEGDEPQVQHERWWRVARSCSTCEVSEQRRRAVGGGCGGKTTDQGEHGADDRVPDAKLGERVERAAPCAGSSKKGQAVTIHRATAPRISRASVKQLLRPQAGSCSRSGRADVAGIRDGPGQAAGGFAQSRAPGHVSSATFQESLHSQAGWATETPGDSSLGGQDRPTCGGNGPQSDLRRGLLGVLVRFPTGA